MTEYGIFTDEGLMERDFYSYEAAETFAQKEYSEDDTYIGEMCKECNDEFCECESGYCDCMEDEND